MSNRFENATSAIIAVAALAMAATYINRSFSTASDPAATGEPQYQTEWKSLLSEGTSTGKPDARVRVVEFADFQCPFCKRFVPLLQAAREETRGDVALTYINAPLALHKYAVIAAHSADCAAMTGNYESYARLLYQKQDSIGIKPWSSFAHDAGVADSVRFSQCLDAKSDPRLASDTAAANKWAVTGTPTILVNGWRFRGLPDSAEFVRVVKELKAGRRPYVEKHWWTGRF